MNKAPEPLMAPEGRDPYAPHKQRGIKRWWIPAIIVAFALTFLGGTLGSVLITSNNRSTNAETIARQIQSARNSSRQETCDAFDNLYTRERERIVHDERQIVSGQWRHLFQLRPEDILKIHKSNKQRYSQSGNQALPAYCPKHDQRTPPYPSLKEINNPPKAQAQKGN